MKEVENVILITIDCLRSDHMEIYGYPRTTSPNMTKLAKEGVLFRNAVANGPFTLASFPSIMTSSYPLEGDIYYSLKGRPPTIGELLHREGFRTAAFNPNILLTLRADYSKSFDFYEGYIHKVSEEFSLAVTGPRRGGVGGAKSRAREVILSISKRFPAVGSVAYMLDRFGKDFPTETSRRITSDAIEWIRSNRDNPFFLWIHYMDVHEPYFMERIEMPKVYSSWAGFLAEIRASHLFNKMVMAGRGLSHQEKRYLRKFLIDVYDDRILLVDSQVGKLMKVLMEEGISKSTAVIITSDHGQAFLEHENVFHRASFYEENLRIPLIVWVGGEGGGVRDDPVSLMDIPPTILSLVGLPPHPEFRGSNALNSGERDALIAEASYDEHGHPFYRLPSSNEINFSFAIYRNGYKFIRHFRMDGSSLTELYDLKNDPREGRNIAREMPDIVEDFERILNDHFDEINLSISREIMRFKIRSSKASGGN